MKKTFAILKNDVVVNVVVADHTFENRLSEIYGKKNVIKCERRNEGGTPGIGYHYKAKEQIFVPFKSWSVDPETGKYKPKTSYPDDGKLYYWDEKTEKWDSVKK